MGTRYQFLAKFGHVPRFPFIPVGSGLNRRTLVYDKDVGRAAALAVSHPAAAGRVFNVTDGGFHTLNLSGQYSPKLASIGGKLLAVRYPAVCCGEVYSIAVGAADRALM